MAVKLRKPADNRFLKALIFAPAGAGKTVLMGTAQQDERTSPMLLLDFEGGTESLAGLDVFVAPIGSWEDYDEVFEHLANSDVVVYNKGEEDEFTVDFGEFKSVGIDSISETHKFALLDILAKEGPSRREPDALQQQDYGKATVQMRRLLREFRDLEMHVIFTAHAKEIEIPREGRVRVPDLAGQMAEEVSGLVSTQGYLAQFEENGETHRTLLLQGVARFRIKCRMPWGKVAPEEIVDPTVTALLDLLEMGDASGEVREARSSRGKLIDDAVPVDDDGTKLPGKDDTEGEAEPEKAQSDAAPGPEADATPKADTSHGDDGKDAQNPDLDKLSLKELKAVGEEQGIDLAGARTRTQARDAIRAAKPSW